ncbi:hypothetical protein diail_4499, partial [Diaporthe ilicicola]
ALFDMGCYEVSLGDTLGVGTAPQVRELIEYLGSQGITVNKLAGHFHDTYGQALANIWEAFKCGITTFDSSVAGLGGCPFAPGARGNAATEDVVYMFENAGVRTGVDLEKLADVGVWISDELGQENQSRAGLALSTRKARSQPLERKADTDEAGWSLLRESDKLLVPEKRASGKTVLGNYQQSNIFPPQKIKRKHEAFHEQEEVVSQIVVTASGRVFCAGMDLRAVAPGDNHGSQAALLNGITHLLGSIDNSARDHNC